MLKRINSALPELILGIIAYGVIAEIVGIWIVTDKLSYTSGLTIGLLIACGMAIHMAVVLEDEFGSGGENHIKARIITKSIIRYFVVAIILFTLAYFKISNIFAVFIGIIGLKIGAYLQPLTHKTCIRLKSGESKSKDF